ncbi:MAG: 4Fe-4S binding protein [Anaerolineae bacterium]|nr:4Fe-4S binding protein [Anaerolineae bacterium]
MLRKLFRIVTGAAALLVGLWLLGERGRLMRPSTLRTFKAYLERYGWGASLVVNALHAYVYGRWTNQYISFGINYLPRIPVLNRLGGERGWADTYHGKVLTHELARKIVTIDKDIDRRGLEQVVPYPVARDLVLNASPDIAVYECCCRHARPNPCEPTRVCMVIGQPFVDFITEHNPHSSQRLIQAEALALLEAEHARGHVHIAWFKDAMLDRFYAICNCCPCCCGGIGSMANPVPALAASGYVAQVDETACAACEQCAEACPFDAIHVNGAAAVDWEKCMGCGICASVCDNEAITLARDEAKGVPLDVRMLADAGE